MGEERNCYSETLLRVKSLLEQKGYKNVTFDADNCLVTVPMMRKEILLDIEIRAGSEMRLVVMAFYLEYPKGSPESLLSWTRRVLGRPHFAASQDVKDGIDGNIFIVRELLISIPQDEKTDRHIDDERDSWGLTLTLHDIVRDFGYYGNDLNDAAQLGLSWN